MRLLGIEQFRFQCPKPLLPYVTRFFQLHRRTAVFFFHALGFRLSRLTAFFLGSSGLRFHRLSTLSLLHAPDLGFRRPGSIFRVPRPPNLKSALQSPIFLALPQGINQRESRQTRRAEAAPCSLILARLPEIQLWITTDEPRDFVEQTIEPMAAWGAVPN